MGVAIGTEASQRRIEERFDLVVNGVTDCGIFLLSPEGTVISCNEGHAASRAFTADHSPPNCSGEDCTCLARGSIGPVNWLRQHPLAV
jgi:hypothetical protein